MVVVDVFDKIHFIYLDELCLVFVYFGIAVVVVIVDGDRVRIHFRDDLLEITIVIILKSGAARKHDCAQYERYYTYENAFNHL